MTSRKTLFQQLDPAAPMQGPGQTPLLDVLRGLTQPTVERSTAPPSLLVAPRTPLLDLYREGARPARDLMSRFVTSLYQPQAPNPDNTQKLEAERVKKADEERKPYSEASINI